MNRSPAFQFYPDKWQSHTRRLSDSSYRVFHELVCWMWQHSPDYCSIEASPAAVSCALAIPLQAVELALQEITNPYAPLLRLESGRWVSNGLRKEADKQKTRSERAKTGAKLRWDGDAKQCLEDANASGKQCLKHANASETDANASENHANASFKQCLPTPTPTPYINTDHKPAVVMNQKHDPDSKPKGKADWKSEAKEQARAASLIAIPLDVMASASIPALWREWCDHRSELALKDKRKPWTVRAATNEMNSIAHAIEEHGEEPVAMQMRAALAGGWQGLNLNTMRPSYARVGSQQRTKAHEQPTGI